MATIVTAIAAWRSARASERSASASERTSRDAMEGLANTIKPGVRTTGVYQRQRDGRLYAIAVVSNTSSKWDATDVTVKIRRRDRTVYEGSTNWLRGGGVGDILEIEIGEIEAPTLGGWESLVIEEIVIRFKDGRGIGLYECRENYSHLTEPAGVPVVTEERVSIGK